MEELRRETDATRSRELYRRVESYLDEGHGSCILREPTRRNIVGDSIRFGHGRRYVLHAYVVMPNHVHILITPSPGQSLAKIIGTMKGFTSREIHKKFGTSGELWQADYFDRFMRDEQHFLRTARYIELNPVKAKLVVDPTHWMESSASRPILGLGSP